MSRLTLVILVIIKERRTVEDLEDKIEDKG